MGKTTGGLAPSLRAGRPAAFNITGNVWAVVVERQNADGTWTKVAVFTDLNSFWPETSVLKTVWCLDGSGEAESG